MLILTYLTFIVGIVPIILSLVWKFKWWLRDLEIWRESQKPILKPEQTYFDDEGSLNEADIEKMIKNTASMLYQQAQQDYKQITQLARDILDNGGIKTGFCDYEDGIPTYLKRKNGQAMDEIAQDMGLLGGDSELYARILTMEQERKEIKSRRLRDYYPKAERIVFEQVGKVGDVTDVPF